MGAAPGAVLKPEQVVGRDELIADLWSILQSMSVELYSVRRMGKTSVLRKMAAEPAEGFMVDMADLEGTRSPEEFAKRVFMQVEARLGAGRRVLRHARSLLSQLDPQEVSGVKLAPGALKEHWKDLVRGVMRDLVEAAEEKKATPVLLWDELPLALGDIAKSDPVRAMEVLDLLRELRQTHASLRMVFSGSVGMHHVLRRLRGSDYRNEPTNDLYAMVLPPLSLDAAAELAYSLLYKGGVIGGRPEAAAGAIAEAVDGVPFYVHHVALAMQLDRSDATPEEAVRHVDALLLDGNDPLQLRHYRERLNLSYEEGERALALATLDTVSTELEPCAFGQLRDLVASRLELTDDELLRDVLALLVKDQYLTRDSGGAHSFALGIVKRWWRRDRGLGE